MFPKIGGENTYGLKIYAKEDYDMKSSGESNNKNSNSRVHYHEKNDHSNSDNINDRSNHSLAGSNAHSIYMENPCQVTTWDSSLLPHAHRSSHRQSKVCFLNKVALSIDLYKLHPKKVAYFLTALDLKMLLKIAPSDLVKYDGSNHIQSITHIKNKNFGLTSFVSRELARTNHYVFYFSVLKYLLRFNNYNSYSCIIKAIQSQKLATNDLARLSKYREKYKRYLNMKNILEDLQDNFFICPLDLLLKDVENSNRNSESEIASMRFCRLVEILVKLQNQKHEFVLKKKYEYWVLSKCYSGLCAKADEQSLVSYSTAGLFLVL